MSLSNEQRSLTLRNNEANIGYNELLFIMLKI